MKELNKDNFNGEIKKGTVLVDFYGDNCTPCQELSPRLEKLSKDYNGKIKFVKVNVGKNSEIATEYGIMSIPTVILFEDGEEKDRSIGNKSNESIKSWINSLV